MTAMAQKHPFHLVDPSPWPLLTSLAAFVLAIGGILAMQGIDMITFYVGTALMLFCMYGWWRDVVKESNTKGVHTRTVQRGLKIGMALFIASEVMFFFGFFWSYFWAAFNPVDAIGGVWPPKGIVTIDPFDLPYLNTLILLLSGTTVTWAHHALLENNRKDLMTGLGLTVALGLIFTVIQGLEYSHTAFTIKDGIYPSTFYLATGFHGFHVIVGTIFLMVCWRRAQKGEFTAEHHVGFEAAAWYWHFVDVVWLFLFISVYWWGYRAPGM